MKNEPPPAGRASSAPRTAAAVRTSSTVRATGSAPSFPSPHGDPITLVHKMELQQACTMGNATDLRFPIMQPVQCFLHSLGLAIFLCGLPNTNELHYTSPDSLYAAYQTPPLEG
jgi:hypothetical protein